MLTGPEGSLGIWTYEKLLDVSLESVLPRVLGPQHSESSRADESRPLTQHGGPRFAVSHQGYRPAIYTDCHAVPPAIGELHLLREGTEGTT